MDCRVRSNPGIRQVFHRWENGIKEDHTENMVLALQLPHAEQMNPDGVR